MTKRSNHRSWNMLLQIFWSFCKIAPATFGGGYAMLPAVEREVVKHHKWLTEEEMARAISIAGASPGGIGVNFAVFIGFKLMGWRGIIAAVAGIMLPTFLIIVSLGVFLQATRQNVKVMAALLGIQVAIISLVAYAGVKMSRSAILDKTTLTLLIISIVMLLLGVHPAVMILLGAAAGVASIYIKEKLRLSISTERSKTASAKASMTQTKITFAPKVHEYYFGDGI
ncbi:chromate transporter [Paenibacillus eucommiae]|uniref:Chromate transporter n=1 Tax=Paenibacillus eucommiae TaxID=1355755 RepID=A0ABS4IVZ6_9BACL|nr:chromate transporter [Paenibacillus eucommiae]MBP1991767.1 chromate transporter [Paenibacillus eucommiae]